jgi:DNA-binding winged helix-turn-helix (wHTH) protein
LADIKDLKFVRITEPNVFKILPRELIKQVQEDYEFTIETIMRYGYAVVANPLVYIYFLTDSDNRTQGVLWMIFNRIDMAFEVYLLSLNPKYQKRNGSVLRTVIDFIAEVQEDIRPAVEKAGFKLNRKILWQTTRPKAFERIGAKPSKRILMELNNETGQDIHTHTK